MTKMLTRGVLTGLGLVAVLALTLAVSGLPVLESLGLMAQGAWGDRFGVARTLVKATPLMIAGLGILLAWRAGLYNIGGEGQFLAGSLLAAALAANGLSGAPPFVAIPLFLAASAIGGGLWAGIAAWLWARRGVEVAVSTILLNFVAIQMLVFASEGPLQEKKRQLPVTDLIPESVRLPRFDPQTDLHWGVLLALGLCAVGAFWLFRTVSGYRVRLVGANPLAARSARLSPGTIRSLTLLGSGALCGLAGGVEYLGVSGQLGAQSAQGWGFLAIPVALVAGLHPLAVPLSAAFFGSVLAGSENLARFSAAGPTLLYVVQGVAVLAILAIDRVRAARLAAGEA